MLRNLISLSSVARSFPVLGMATMLLGTGVNAASALDITTSTDGTALANALVSPFPGVSISNVNLVGGSTSAGFFSNGMSSGIGLDEGIILTSGDAQLAPGPNVTDNATLDFGGAGDADLDTLTTDSTFDATTLTFDITTTTGDIFIQYAFASEEYNEFVNSSFNDVFGFFVDGTNIALIPGTNTPVTINNVNNNLNSQFYNDNDPSDLGTPTPFDIEYDGFTNVFTATATGLVPGQTYTLKLGVADTADFSLDSAVFISAVADVPPPPPGTPEPATVAGLVALGAFGATLKRRKNS